MTINLSHFGLGFTAPLVDSGSRSIRPPSWPPPKDWVCIEDKAGKVFSRYGDYVWDFTPWYGKTKVFSFGDGPKLRANSLVIDPANAELLRQLVVWRLWGPRASQNIKSLLVNFAYPIRKIIEVCSKNKILASDLWRYPVLIDKIAQTLAPSHFGQVIAELDRLRDARRFLGFELLDVAGIRRLKEAQPEHQTEQTEYIPTRIWTYVVNRVSECIRDYLAHQEKIEACFAFCVRAYELNNAIDYWKRTRKSHRNPFQVAPPGKNGARSGITYHDHFAVTAQKYEIKNLLEKWSGKIEGPRGIVGFSNYLTLVRYAALVDIVAFTLMRIEEAASVRWNCLLWHDDPVYGRIPLIESETTKTDPDDSGLWITSPSVEPAVHTLQSIAQMRISCDVRLSKEANPRLITPAVEHWASSKAAIRSGVKLNLYPLCEVLRNYHLLFDLQELTITEDDLKIAKAICPTLNADRFQIGKSWPLTWHQFRRTGAVNMFASGQISDSSIQLQMKHLTRLQPLYYGRGNSALRLNDSARVLLINAQYETMGRQLNEVHTNRFISPYGNAHKENILATRGCKFQNCRVGPRA